MDVSEFLVEVYVSRATTAFESSQPENLSRAAEQLSREGRPVRFVRSFFVPEEETCFYLFESQTSEAVREAVIRAGVPCDHLVEAAAIWKTPPPGADSSVGVEGCQPT
jgi:hypothetical protein